MFLIKVHDDMFITSQSISRINMEDNSDIRIDQMNGESVYVPGVSSEKKEEKRYIFEAVIDAIAEMTAQEQVKSITPQPPKQDGWGWSTVKIKSPVPIGDDAILDLRDVVNTAKEEFEIGLDDEDEED